MKQTSKPVTRQVNVRMDGRTRSAIEAMRRNVDPIPSVGEIVRQAVLEKYARDMKRPLKRNGIEEQDQR